MTHLAEVHTIYAENARSIPDMLRRSADSIETEVTEGYARTCSIVAGQVADDGTIQVYGWGDTDRLHALGALAAGCQSIGQMILDTGE